MAKLTPETLRAIANSILRGEPFHESYYAENLRSCASAWEASVVDEFGNGYQAGVLAEVERKHIDATPDDGLPLRILRAYRADCDLRWADSSDGEVGKPVMIALNEMQDKRAVILDRAIAALAASEEKKP